MPEGKSPPIGRLRNFAAVFVWHDIPDAEDPEVSPAYLRAGHCFCSIRVRAGEMWLSGAQLDEMPGPRGTHIIRTRFREDFTTRHMLEVNGKRFRILSVNNDDARRFTELQAELWGDDAIIHPGPPIPP